MSYIVKRWSVDGQYIGFEYLAGDPRASQLFGYAETQRGAQKFPTRSDAYAAIQAHPAVPYRLRVVRLVERICAACGARRTTENRSEGSSEE